MFDIKKLKSIQSQNKQKPKRKRRTKAEMEEARRLDGLYYECTYNGDKNELYVDVYTKIENVCISKEYKEYL